MVRGEGGVGLAHGDVEGKSGGEGVQVLEDGGQEAGGLGVASELGGEEGGDADDLVEGEVVPAEARVEGKFGAGDDEVSGGGVGGGRVSLSDGAEDEDVV